MTTLSLSSLLLLFTALLSCFISDGVEAFAAANNNNKKKGGNNNNTNKLKKKKTTGGNNNSGGSSSSFGGFGTPPETYNDVINGFKTRLPGNNEEGDVPCPCNNGGNGNGDGNDDDDSEHKKIPKTFNECCGPLIAATAVSAAAAASSQDESQRTTLGCFTPRQVLQSRYVAFYYRDVNHIIQTTNQVCRDYQENKIIWAKELDQNGMFDSFDFVGLTILKEEEIIDKQHNDNEEAYIEFTVRLRGRTYEESSSRSIKRSTEQSSLSSIEGDETVVSEKSKFLKDTSTGIWTYAGGDVRSNVQGLDDITLNA